MGSVYIFEGKKRYLNRWARLVLQVASLLDSILLILRPVVFGSCESNLWKPQREGTRFAPTLSPVSFWRSLGSVGWLAWPVALLGFHLADIHWYHIIRSYIENRREREPFDRNSASCLATPFFIVTSVNSYPFFSWDQSSKAEWRSRLMMIPWTLASEPVSLVQEGKDRKCSDNNNGANSWWVLFFTCWERKSWNPLLSKQDIRSSISPLGAMPHTWCLSLTPI